MMRLQEGTIKRWSLVLLALTICAGASMRIVFSPLQELAKREMSLTDLQLSLVQGLAASIPVALLAIPIGRMVDRANRMRILLVLMSISVAGTLLTAAARGFEALFFTRMLAGLGAVCAIPVAISIAADLSTVERRGRALLLLSLGQAVGVALGFAAAGALLAVVGQHVDGFLGLSPWRAVHVVFGIASLALLLPLFALREPARQELGTLSSPDVAEVARELWQRRGWLVPLFIGQVGVVMADVAAGIWAAPVLTRDHGLGPEQFAAWMGAAVLLPGILGSLIGGLAADWGQKSMRRGGILYGAVVASAAAIPTALFPVVPSLEGFAAVLSVFLLCGAITGLVTATVIACRIPNELRGVCLGLFIVVSAVIGSGIAPTAVTLVSSALGGEAHLATALAGTGIVISVVAFAAFVLAALRLPSAPPLQQTGEAPAEQSLA
jgi:MFS family permease